MEKVASAFIALILINVLCTSWTLKTPVKKADGYTEASLNTIAPNLIKVTAIISEKSKPEFKPLSGVLINVSDTDTFVFDKRESIDKVQNGNPKKSIQKDEIHELRKRRFEKVVFGLAQFLNNL